MSSPLAGKVDVCTWAYLDPSAFAEVPDVPPSACHVAAEVVHLISHQNGRVKAMPGLEVLRNFSSFMDVVMNVQLDECIKKSTETWTEHSEINHLVFGLPG